MVFVDMPGSERLAMDPELLRLREGQVLNKGLLSFASTLATLSRDGSSQFVNYEECVLTRLLAGEDNRGMGRSVWYREIV